jgi:hypothetical protein
MRNILKKIVSYLSIKKKINTKNSNYSEWNNNYCVYLHYNGYYDNCYGTHNNHNNGGYYDAYGYYIHYYYIDDNNSKSY